MEPFLVNETEPVETPDGGDRVDYVAPAKVWKLVNVQITVDNDENEESEAMIQEDNVLTEDRAIQTDPSRSYEDLYAINNQNQVFEEHMESLNSSNSDDTAYKTIDSENSSNENFEDPCEKDQGCIEVEENKIFDNEDELNISALLLSQNSSEYSIEVNAEDSDDWEQKYTETRDDEYFYKNEIIESWSSFSNFLELFADNYNYINDFSGMEDCIDYQLSQSVEIEISSNTTSEPQQLDSGCSSNNCDSIYQDNVSDFFSNQNGNFILNNEYEKSCRIMDYIIINNRYKPNTMDTFGNQDSDASSNVSNDEEVVHDLVINKFGNTLANYRRRSFERKSKRSRKSSSENSTDGKIETDQSFETNSNDQSIGKISNVTEHSIVEANDSEMENSAEAVVVSDNECTTSTEQKQDEAVKNPQMKISLEDFSQSNYNSQECSHNAVMKNYIASTIETPPDSTIEVSIVC